VFLKVLTFLAFITLYASLSHAVPLDLVYSDDELDAKQIVSQSYFVDHFYAFDNFVIGYKNRPDMLLMTENNGAWQKIKLERALTHNPKNNRLKSQDLVVFKSGKVRGTGILLNDFKQPKPMAIRMWLPALRKIRRIAEPALQDIWGGSLLTYGDLYLRRPEHETHQIIDNKKFDHCLEDITRLGIKIESELPQKPEPWCQTRGSEVYVIESKSQQQPWWYDYRIRLIDKKTFAEYEVEYFKNGKLIKRFQKNWHRSGLSDSRAQIFNFWTVLTFENKAVAARSLAWSSDESISWNIPVPARLWSEATLRKIRK